MKKLIEIKKILIVLCMCISAFLSTVNAQLKVDSDNNIGIGEDDPKVKLHIKTTNDVSSLIFAGATGTGISGLYFDASNGDFKGADYGSILQDNDLSVYINNYGNKPIIFKTNQTERLRILGSGNVGIGTNNPSYKLHVNGKIYATGTITSSDKRFKQNIASINKLSSLNKITRLQGVSYELISENKKPDTRMEQEVFLTENDTMQIESAKITKASPRKHLGFIAQDVKEIFPELVYEDNEGYLGIDYTGLIPVLVEALKEQEAKLEEMEKIVVELNEKLKKKE